MSRTLLLKAAECKENFSVLAVGMTVPGEPLTAVFHVPVSTMEKPKEL
jgi:hypothetical protein